MYFLRGSLPWQGLKATTKKQKYQRILERKQSTHPDQLCRGYPPEFRDYFAHCLSLGFEDRPDYRYAATATDASLLLLTLPAAAAAVRRYLKRIFRDLFERQSFEDDGVFDWDVIKKQQQRVVSGGDDNHPSTATDAAMVNESDNPTSAVRTGAESAQNNPMQGGAGAGAADPNAPLRQPTTTSNNGIGGSNSKDRQEDDSLNGADKNSSEFKDTPGAPRRSLISSIR